MEWQDMMSKGGPVMWILLTYSIIGLAIVLERIIVLSMQTKHHDDRSTLKSWQQSPESAIVLAIEQAHIAGIQDLKSVATRVGSTQVRRMESGLGTLAWLGNTAPLLGLFGTITGMIKAFMVIEQAGGKVDAQALAGGIWEAMMTTGAGLAVAIPLLFLLHLIESLVARRTESMRQAASLSIEQLHQPSPTACPTTSARPSQESHAV